MAKLFSFTYAPSDYSIDRKVAQVVAGSILVALQKAQKTLRVLPILAA